MCKLSKVKKIGVETVSKGIQAYFYKYTDYNHRVNEDKYTDYNHIVNEVTYIILMIIIMKFPKLLIITHNSFGKNGYGHDQKYTMESYIHYF